MITLFVKTGCPYCEKVLAELDAYGVPYETKNIADEAVVGELMEKGGKRQVPFMLDGGTAMYESDDIVAYINQTYGVSSGSAAKPRIHVAGGHCSSDAGKGGCSF